MAIGINGGVVLVVLFAGALLYWNLWRAVLCIAPSSLRIEADVPGDKVQVPSELTALSRALAPLGFTPLGSRVEKPRFGKETQSYDYALPSEKTFATLYVGRDGRPRLYYLTPLRGGGMVITANYRRPARAVPGRYLSGGLEDVAPDRVLKAHQRRVETVGIPDDGAFDQESRVAAARAWFKGFGRWEVRLQNMHGLLWSLGSLGMVGAAIFSDR